MYNKILLKHAVSSFIFVSAAGTLLHFAYDWSGQNRLIGFISAVNESTWEHMKLMFMPMLLYSLFLWIRFHKSLPPAFPAFSLAALVAVFIIPVLFYTYRGVLGFNVNFLNLLIFYIGASTGSVIFYKAVCKYDLSQLNILLFIAHITLLIMFIFFTYTPPDLGIFISPV